MLHLLVVDVVDVLHHKHWVDYFWWWKHVGNKCFDDCLASCKKLYMRLDATSQSPHISAKLIIVRHGRNHAIQHKLYRARYVVDVLLELRVGGL
jgi:hypothetical protein